MANLVIVESPAKAHTIERYLGKGFTVKASMGHVRDLPASKLGVDVEKNFTPEYVISPRATKTIAALKKAAKTAETIYMATDLDREGEAIAWHLAEALKLPPEKIIRVVFNEITRSAVLDAFAHPGTLNIDRVNAQQARRILDRIVGYKLSPLLWRKVMRGLSAGRVQSVAVKIVVDRELEIEAFKPEEFWEIEVALRPQKSAGDKASEFTAKLAKIGRATAKIHNEAEGAALVARLQGAPFTVAKVDARVQRGRPSPPFTTSTLQQTASTQLHYRPARTMVFAQQLYEGVELGPEGSVGLITYMRTDSTRMAPQALDECRQVISEQFGADYLPKSVQVYAQSKRAQAAHEAIRPTSAARLPEQVKPFLSREQFRLYELIWQRFVASQMTASQREVVALEIAAADAIFAAEGKRLVFDGFERVIGLRAKDVDLPALTAGEALKLMAMTPSQHFTEPPARFSEASLIRTLERLGIGRPSTYAPIISTIQLRKYVKQSERRLFATELGKVVTVELTKHFADLINVRFTSEMENQLDEVEEGKVEWHQLLQRFYDAFEKDLAMAMEKMDRVPGRETGEKCEKCGKPLLIRSGKFGLFIGCSGYPECTFKRPFEGQAEAEEGPTETKEVCDKCGKPMVVRTGRRGKFLGCSGYPNCKGTKSIDGKPTTATPTDIKCEKCGKAMVIRHSKRGAFLGCSGYPSCRNTKPMPEKEEGGEAPKGGDEEV